MGKHIDTVKVLRATGRGSDYFGSCECCKKPVSEVFVMERRRVFRRSDNSTYDSPVGGGLYGHKDCLIKAFGAANIER